MYQNTITLFNYHAMSGLWYASVFSGTDLGARDVSDLTKNGDNSDDRITAIIHCTKDKVFTTSDGIEKRCVGAKEYTKCDNPSEVITFNPGHDFIYDGEYPDLKPVSDDDYESGFYHAINEEYDGVYMVTSASFYDLLPHFEIGGK